VGCCFVKDAKLRPAAASLLGHPWITKAEHAPKINYDETSPLIKEHNKLHHGNKVVSGNPEEPNEEDFSENSENSDNSEDDDGNSRSVKAQRPSKAKEKVTLEVVTRERDALFQENKELKLKIEQLTQELNLKNGKRQ